jgi:hypothetical protein
VCERERERDEGKRAEYVVVGLLVEESGERKVGKTETEDRI